MGQSQGRTRLSEVETDLGWNVCSGFERTKSDFREGFFLGEGTALIEREGERQR